MAIHVYQCINQHQFEVTEPASKESKPRCPECGKQGKLTVARTGAPILKRGSGGFYAPTKD